MGFVYYQEEGCDKIVMEVGIGGTMDTTNVITDPLATVVTSIGMDHAEVLGGTLDSIAQNKAGIMKRGRPMVIGAGCQSLEIFKRRSKQLRAPLYIADSCLQKNFDAYNNSTVSKLFSVLETNNLAKLSISAKQSALAYSQPCRKQYISRPLLPIRNQQLNNLVILDVGHNPPALLALFETLRQSHPSGKFIVLYGTSKYKDSAQSIENILKYSDEVYLIEADHFRAMGIDVLEGKCGSDRVKVVEGGRVEGTLRRILEGIGEGDVVVVCGSFFVMKEAKGVFEREKVKRYSDPDIRQKERVIERDSKEK